jgi:hypothetical protein
MQRTDLASSRLAFGPRNGSEMTAMSLGNRLANVSFATKGKQRAAG